MLSVALAIALGASASPRIAVMPVGSGEGVPGRTAEAVTEAVAAEVRRYGGAEVITQKEIVAVLSLEQQKQMLGCQSDSCMAELGGALGVDRMITGELARLGESWLFHLKLTDVVKVKVIAQSDRRLRRGSIDDVLDVLPAMVVELFPRLAPGPRPAEPGAGAGPAELPAAPAARAEPARPAAPVAEPASLRRAGEASPGAAEPRAFAERLPPPTAPMPRPEAARKVARAWTESSIRVPLAERRDLAVYTDDRGLFLAVAPFEAAYRRVFAGTAEKLFAQEVELAGAIGTTAHGFTFWEPRARTRAEAFFEVRSGKARLFCGSRELPLRILSRGEAERVLASATFYGPRWRREPHVLARDDEGNWFYVDRARAAAGTRGGPDYRLYAGPLGKLSRLELSGVSEEAGALVLVTASGKLRLGQGADGAPTADWLAGGGRRMLRRLDPARTGTFVYRDLGVYRGDRLGTPCDGAIE